MSADYPYGTCECTYGCADCGGRGPVAWEVTRDGKRLRLCTRCDLRRDTDKVLLVTAEDKPEPWKSYDPLGFMCIVFDLANRQKDAAKESD